MSGYIFFNRSLKNNKISDISVSDICNETGVSMQTFYRHFRDKEDLINWSIDVILENSFKHMGKGVSLNDALNRKLDYIKEERVLFNKAFKMDNQNNMREHDFELIYAFYKNMIESKNGEKISDEMDFVLKMYCQGSVDMTADWVLGGGESKVSTVVDNLIAAMPYKLSLLFEELNLI